MSSASSFSRLPAVRLAVDVVVLTVVNGQLAVLVRDRMEQPFRGRWVLPGSLVRSARMGLDELAYDVLYKDLGPVDLKLKQFGVFAAPERDPRGWAATSAYLGVMPCSWLGPFVASSNGFELAKIIAYDEHGLIELNWSGGPVLPGFDHEQIILSAIAHLRREIDWSMLAFDFLPREFTLLELLEVHEAVLAKRLDKTLFRKRMLERTFADGSRFEPTGEMKLGRHRPAKYYRLARAVPRVALSPDELVGDWDPARRRRSLRKPVR